MSRPDHILPQRENALHEIAAAQILWDIIVIGGGATGLGTALEAATRGYKVLLLEQSDFAKGTSGKSTKLIHGGVRYLAQGNIKLVREASIERGLLIKNARHLVENKTFIVPVYHFWDVIKYRIGLKLYDWISGSFSMGASYFLPAKKAAGQLPGVIVKNLKGAILYHDGQFDDSRLAINLFQSIWDHQGFAFNYMKVQSLIKDVNGIITGLHATDVETGKEFSFLTKAVVNATGVFADQILLMDNPQQQKTIRASQGIHLVLPRSFYPSDKALLIPKTSDGRVLFIVPWHQKVLVGTTDTPVDSISLEPVALAQEINFILNSVSEYLINKPEQKDVLSVFAGLRPLAANQYGNQNTKEISRGHKMIISPSQLFSVIGGKWTTYRKMAEDCINKIEQKLQWPHRPSVTQNLALHGNTATPNLQHPFYYYGSDLEKINWEGEWISEALKIHSAQVKWAVQQEMCRTVEDFLSRRTRALLLDASESLRIAPTVALLMANELNRDEKWIAEQLKQFHTVAQSYLIPQ